MDVLGGRSKTALYFYENSAGIIIKASEGQDLVISLIT